ncbi:sugar ABC transporter substrate-binding protein [Nonomuraea bangladeshensis]|uniref:sugar ABC transporter substrate-binding protein n=1 Tax=Nonomuraea bangladeshensis TaxID=404385 RepID=UPI003C2CF184
MNGTARRWLAVATAAATALGLASCGNDDDADDGPVTSLTVQTYTGSPSDDAVYDAVLTACGGQIGVTIDRQKIPTDGYVAKVLQQASARTLPDALMLDNGDVQQLAAAGALAPVQDLGLSAAGFAEGAVQAATYDGKVYALQPVANTIGLFYNEQALAKAGVTPPKTWDELRAAARKLTSGKQYGLAFSAVATVEGAWQFMPFLWSNGGDETQLATPQVAGALGLWANLVTDGSVSKSVVNWTQADVNDQFKAGNAAMMINGPWQFPVLDQVSGLTYKVIPIPVPKAGDKEITPLGGETWSIPQTGRKNRMTAAAKLVDCLNSDSNQIALAGKRQLVPTRSSAVAPFIEQQPALATFTEQVQASRARTAKLGPKWPEAEKRINTAIQSALVGGLTPEQALEQATHG